MRYRWVAVFGVAALVGCGAPATTNVAPTQTRAAELAQNAAIVATANAPTATPRATTTPSPVPPTAVPPTMTATAPAPTMPPMKLPTATTAPTKAPTVPPTTAPVAQYKIDVLGYELVAPSYGYGRVLGMVQNTGSKPASYRVSAALIDATGKTVGAHEAATQAGIIAPGEQGPFEIIYNSTDTPAFTGVKFTVQVSGTTGFSLRGNAKPAIGEQNAAVAKDGNLRVAGQVQNAGAVGMDLTQIIYAGFSATGKLMAVGSTFTRPTAIAVGGTAPFEFAFNDPRIVDYAIWLDAWESK